MMAGRALRKIQQEMNNFQIKEVDVLAHPLTAIKEGITMIPTLQLDGERLSGIFLNEQQIRDFLHTEDG